MKIRLFQIILSLMIILSEISYNNIVYADVATIAATTTNLSGVVEGFSAASSAMSSSIPVGVAITGFLKINNFVTVEGQKQAQRDFDLLSQEDKLFYKTAFNYWEVNQEYYNWTGTNYVMSQNVSELKELGTPYLNKVKDYYSKVNDQVNQVKQQLGLTVVNGVSSVAGTIEELKEKLSNVSISLQLDTDFINSNLDIEKKFNKSISDKFSITSALPVDYSNLSYNELYYTLSSNKARLDFLYKFSDYIISMMEYSSVNYELSLPFKFIVFDTVEVQKYNSQAYYFNVSHSLNLRTQFNYGVPRSYNMTVFPYLTSKISTNYNVKDVFKGDKVVIFDPYSYANLYDLSTASVSIGFERYGYIPSSLVLGYIETPFNSIDDVIYYKRQYLGIPSVENRPINYKITLDNLQKGNLGYLEPLTRELATSLPSVNVTSFPLVDTLSLPTQKEVDDEKEKSGLAVPNLGLNQDVYQGIDGLKTKGDIESFITSLFVPSSDLFQKLFIDLQSKMPDTINPLYYRDFFIKQRDELSLYYFDDYYIDILNQRIKIIDMRYFRDSLPEIKKYTDFFFWLLLLLYNYNEIYFVIRGVKPLSTIKKQDD